MGKTVAIVGPSGSGKSTIGKLIFGFYKPSSGKILIDGRDSADLKTATVRRQLAVTPQDIVLFNDTLEYNIKYGSNHVSDDKLNSVIEQVDLTDFILSLPDGLVTQVGERGLKLSGGEKQRVAIARAMVSEPKVLLADEPTGALDSNTSKEVMDLIQKINKAGKTILVVTHEHDISQMCSRIVKLKDGVIVEDKKIKQKKAL